MGTCEPTEGGVVGLTYGRPPGRTDVEPRNQQPTGETGEKGPVYRQVGGSVPRRAGNRPVTLVNDPSTETHSSFPSPEPTTTVNRVQA
jgi:hypothetical protein